MNKAILAAAVLGCALSTTASADVLGFEVGGYVWQQDYEGDIQDGSSVVDLDTDLALDDDNNNVFYIALEHPIPLLPNIRLQQTEIKFDGESTLSRNIDFDGQTFNINADVVSDLDLSHTDATLYYEILDNWVSLDLGLTVRKFDGSAEIALADGSQVAREVLDDAVPMLYLGAKFELPLTGLYAGANANAISAGDSTITDYQIKLGYETDFGLGIEAGVRRFDLDYEDDDEEADVVIDGSYIGVFYHF